MAKKIKILTVSDIHFGIKRNIELFEKSIDFCIETINNIKPNHVFVLGDTFDRSLSLTHDHVKLFIKLIIGIKKTKGCKLHFIEGTASHDMRQVEPFLPFGKIDYYYQKAQVIDLDGYKTLILPEEYRTNYLKKYEELFKDKYDFIFGHGNIEGLIYAEHSMTQSYIHKLSDLRRMTIRYCLFGHNHVKKYDSVLNPKIIYNSSLYRWSHEGEREPKGMHLITVDKDDHTSIKFIKNEFTPRYITKNISKFIPNVEEFKDSDFINSVDTFVEDVKEHSPNVVLRFNLGKNKLPSHILDTIDVVANKYDISIKAKPVKKKFNVVSEILDDIENNNALGLTDLNSILTISNELLDSNNIDPIVKEKTMVEIRKILDE